MREKNGPRSYVVYIILNERKYRVEHIFVRKYLKVIVTGFRSASKLRADN